MRQSIIPQLRCPNASGGLTAHAIKSRGKDIECGVLISGEHAYPIVDYVAVLLSDEDADAAHFCELLKTLRNDCPNDVKGIIDATISRLASQTATRIGNWNREEMAFYDNGLGADIDAVTKDVCSRPVWQIFEPRREHIFRHFENTSSGISRTHLPAFEARYKREDRTGTWLRERTHSEPII